MLMCCRRYKLISHPGSTNPFPFAYLNFRSYLQCKSITVGDQTFMEWEGDLDTEAAVICAVLLVFLLCYQLQECSTVCRDGIRLHGKMLMSSCLCHRISQGLHCCCCLEE